MKLIECVPNFSEGTNEKVIKEILDVFRNSEVKLLDKIYDKEYNRLVVTIVGDAERVKESVLKASDVAISRIDMRKHRGSHPRIGAVDVIPFVPLKDINMRECIALSREFARELSEKHNLPVFLYEKSVTSHERRDIDFLRKGEFEGLLKILKERKPDFGPETPHPTAGATITGAREIMVGLNVNLSTSNLEVAKKIAKAIHSKSGGLMYVKAMATPWKGITQIGMSNTNYRKTPLHRQFELIRTEAERYNVKIVSSEFCGLVPIEAMIDVLRYYLKLEDFSKDKIIELNL